MTLDNKIGNDVINMAKVRRPEYVGRIRKVK